MTPIAGLLVFVLTFQRAHLLQTHPKRQRSFLLGRKRAEMTAGHQHDQVDGAGGDAPTTVADGTTSTATNTASSSTREGSSSDDNAITILGFGSLLSEKSSRMTFPDLTNFRLARVPNYRRVFAHPASIFFQRGIACLETLQMSSLSVEYCEGSSFVASVFEVPSKDMMNDGVPSLAFLEREEEFHITTVPYTPLMDILPDDGGGDADSGMINTKGIICERSTDEAYIDRWGEDRFQKHYKQYGVDTIWGWEKDSGLRPCAVYLRHCYLAAKTMGDECCDSFLDETFLVDRVTTIRQYLEENPSVLEALPPPELALRYNG